MRLPKLINLKYKLLSASQKEFYLFLENLLAYSPKELSLYERAVIHKSATQYDSQGVPINNERLEYLGDAILGAIVAEFLFNRFPTQDEGYLTQLRSRLVNRSILTKLANDLGLSSFLQSNIKGGLKTSHIYGDVLEAIVGALYLDQGYDRTREFIIKRLIPEHIDLSELESYNTNFKSQLIEWVQKHKKEVEFHTVQLPTENNKNAGFITSIICDGAKLGKGRGKSKKEAQQNAAKAALNEISKKDTEDV